MNKEPPEQMIADCQELIDESKRFCDWLKSKTAKRKINEVEYTYYQNLEE